MSTDLPPAVEGDPPEDWFWEWPEQDARHRLLDRLTSWLSWH